MRTISRHRDTSSPRGDVRRLCSYCGVAWMRSQLMRDASGNLACPDDAEGLDIVTLSEGNAEAAATRQIIVGDSETDGATDSPNTVPYPGFVSPDGHKGGFGA